MHRTEILDTAKQYVSKDRNATHGEPEDNFQHIADFWNVWISMKLSKKTSDYHIGDPVIKQGDLDNLLDATDVAILMDLMKTARLITSPECVDHWIDKAGYSACGGGIATSQKDD